MKTLGFIGGGKVTRILLESLENRGFNLSSVIVSDKDSESLKKLSNKFNDIKTLQDSNKTAASQDIIFLAVHPPIMPEVTEEISTSIDENAIVISLAPKIGIKTISDSLNGFSRVTRMIPNAPSIINKGYNPICFSKTISMDEKQELLELFSIFGRTTEVDEDKLEAYAILTAMGPTYFWFQFKKLMELGKSFGLDENEIVEGLSMMLTGAVHTFFNSELDHDEVIDLIPVKPLAEEEENINRIYEQKLSALFQQLKG
ncbi:MAG: NAD(P)-binding domain-containing protein [Methanobacteriaceae archaeon]|nr:NAD(P)-binding domain-containing protein [Methanobacteriaceae archaeon]